MKSAVLLHISFDCEMSGLLDIYSGTKMLQLKILHSIKKHFLDIFPCNGLYVRTVFDDGIKEYVTFIFLVYF